MTKWLWKRPGTGVWYATWKEKGETKRRSLGTTRKRDAEQKMRTFRPKRRYTGGGKTTTRRAVDAWVRFKLKGRRKLTRSTENLYLQLPQILGDLGDLPCGAIAPQDVERWCDGMEQEGKSVFTIRRAVSVLAAAIEWAAAYHPQWGFHGNAAKAVLKTIPRPLTTRKPAADDSIFRGIIERLRASERPPFVDLADALEAQWFCGLRCTELARLTWEDVDIERRSWIIRSPANKGGEREIPFHPRVAEILDARLGEIAPFPVEGCTSQRWKMWKREDVPSRTFDRGSIRHSFITRLRSAGLHVEAKDLARHSQPSMSDHYTHPHRNSLIAALGILRS